MLDGFGEGNPWIDLGRIDSVFGPPVPSLWLLYAMGYVRESKKIQPRGAMRRRVMAFRVAGRVGQELRGCRWVRGLGGGRLQDNVGENLLTVPLGVE